MKLHRCVPENKMNVAFEDGSGQDEGDRSRGVGGRRRGSRVFNITALCIVNKYGIQSFHCGQVL